MQVSDMDINAPSRILPSPHRRRRIVSLASLQCLKLRAINSLRTEASKTSYKRRFLCMSLPYNSFFYHNSQHCYTFLTHACFFHKKISYLLKKFSQLVFFAGFFTRKTLRDISQCWLLWQKVACCMEIVFNVKFFWTQ